MVFPNMDVIPILGFLLGLYLAHMIHGGPPPESEAPSAGDRLIKALADLDIIKPKKP